MRVARQWFLPLVACILAAGWFGMFGHLFTGGTARPIDVIAAAIFGLAMLGGIAGAYANANRIIRMAERGELRTGLLWKRDREWMEPKRPDSEAVSTPSRGRGGRPGSGFLILWVVITLLCLVAATYFQLHRDGATSTVAQGGEKGPVAGKVTYAEFVEQVKAEPSPCAPLLAGSGKLAQSADRQALNRALKQALLCKIRRPSYQRAKASRDHAFLLDKGQPFPEEGLIRRLRLRLAELRPVPEGVSVLPVPAAKQPPAIDGSVDAQEWQGALELPVRRTRILVRLLADRERLYLALSVPEETQQHNYSSLQVIWHEGLSPWLEEAYQFVYGQGYANSGCRISPLKWPDPPLPGGFSKEERWKGFRLNECGLFTSSRGASSLSPHRVYEYALDRAEAGLPAGHPFPLRLVVETAPQQQGQRSYIGPLNPHGKGWSVWLYLP
ncbi:MAG: hypothetical protein D6786_03970 [Gammaproteobacteria bacterium]|nr:MAG: hypothetical protein D6786_03970 [Gammaproteobacteria bacterium]